MSKAIVKKNIIWIVAFLMFLSLQPYFIWKYASSMNWLVNLPLYIVFLLNYDGKRVKYFVLFAIISSLAAVVSNNSLFGIILMGLLSTLFLTNTSFLTIVFYTMRALRRKKSKTKCLHKKRCVA